jgi:enterochelin esterase-like enzyme
MSRRTLALALVATLVAAVGAEDKKAPDKKLAPAPEGFDAKRKDVERGKVEVVEYTSKSVGGKRKMVVYTPPGYSKDKKYPVLYLLHGMGDNEHGWTRNGAAARILDNLIADKKVASMIVVMPNGHPGGNPFARGGFGFGPGTALAKAILKRAGKEKGGKLTADELAAAMKEVFKSADKDKKGSLDEQQLANAFNRLFREGTPRRRGGPRGGFDMVSAMAKDLLKDVIPHVEKHYSVQAGREHRAITGLSMGGGQALTIGLKHLDTFAWVGGFSSAIFGQSSALIGDPAKARKKLRLLWVSCGDKDGLMRASKSFHDALADKKVPHVWHVDSGGHTWPVWRNDLYLFAQRLFRDK